MKRNLILAFVVAAGVAALATQFFAPRGSAPRAGAAPATSQSKELPVASILQVRPAGPGHATDTSASAPLPIAHSASAAILQFRERRDLASLYRTVENDTSPEARYLRAEIYSLCARKDDKTPSVRAQENETFRAKFVAGISADQANGSRRLEALDRINRDVCRGLDLGKLDPKELARLLKAAAEAGDARARAWQLAERIEQSSRENRIGPSGFNLNEEDFATMRTLLASGHPEVIQDLQGILSSTLSQGVIQLGGVTTDNQALYSALTLLACDAGASCGPDAPMILTECAYRGRCDAGSLYEFLFYYQTSPSEAQAIDSYHRALSSMLRTGDFAGLTYAQVPIVPGFNMMFGGRRADRSVEVGSSAVDSPPPPKRKPAENA